MSQAFEFDQAHIPQNYTKSLQSRALMLHYQQAQARKIKQEQAKIQQRNRQKQAAVLQRQRHQQQVARRKLQKSYQQNHYAQEYEQMISQRKQKQYYDKHQSLWLERELLQNGKHWMIHPSEQKQIQKRKKVEYGRYLQDHLKRQEDKRIQQADKIKLQRQKHIIESQAFLAKDQAEQQMNSRRKSMFEQQNKHKGIKDVFNWHTEQENLQDRSRTLTPRLQQMLKVQQRKAGEGQFKSQNQRRYFIKNDTDQHSPLYQRQHEPYNPITNPIVYRYKNPTVLKRLISQV